jgi:hypothetical protein
MEASTSFSDNLDEIALALNQFYILVMSIVVFSMQLGFTLLEAGSVRKKNVNNILTKVAQQPSLPTELSRRNGRLYLLLAGWICICARRVCRRLHWHHQFPSFGWRNRFQSMVLSICLLGDRCNGEKTSFLSILDCLRCRC